MSFDVLETRPCETEDFNWGNRTSGEKDSLFYTAGSLEPIKTNWLNLICIVDPKQLYSNGNYDTASIASFMVVFEKCDPT